MYKGVYIFPFSLVGPAPLDYVIPLYSLLIGMSISLSGAPAGVSVFSDEKTVFWREQNAGHYSSAYYVGKNLAAVPRFVLSALHFTSIYMYLASPTFPGFNTMFAIILGNYFGIYGMSAIVSVIVKRENANLMAVVFGIFTSVFCGFGPNLTQAKRWGIIFLWELSCFKWGSEALFSAAIMPYSHVYDIEITRNKYGYTLDRVGFDIGMSFMLGFLFRAIGYLCLLISIRSWSYHLAIISKWWKRRH